VLTVFLPTEK